MGEAIVDRSVVVSVGAEDGHLLAEADRFMAPRRELRYERCGRDQQRSDARERDGGSLPRLHSPKVTPG